MTTSYMDSYTLKRGWRPSTERHEFINKKEDMVIGLNDLKWSFTIESTSYSSGGGFSATIIAESELFRPFIIHLTMTNSMDMNDPYIIEKVKAETIREVMLSIESDYFPNMDESTSPTVLVPGYTF